MSKTIFVDCNRLNSIDKDSNNNAEWTYNLKESISLPAGSSIQIQNSFLNQKGILGSSIEIEEDIEEIISYYYIRCSCCEKNGNWYFSHGSSIELFFKIFLLSMYWFLLIDYF